MTAEPIAQVIADIRSGRVHHPAAFDRYGVAYSTDLLQRAQQPQPVVDCTAVFHMQRVAETIALYDDHPQITPPWTDALLCYVNTFGNVVAMQVHRKDWDGTAPSRDEWMTDNEVDWAHVRWVAETAIWVGGVSGDGRVMPTSGPCHLFRHAIHDDGSPADINWLALMMPRGRFAERRELGDANQAMWDASMVTLGASLNFLNASNTDIAEPARPRPLRRRIARTGVQVQAIVVRPPGKHRTKSATARPIDASETVFSPVRGHWARYGPAFNRGLLFGKYAGKYWVSSHLRGGHAEDAQEQRDYRLQPAGGLLMREMTEQDFARIKAAVRLRDRAVELAEEGMVRAELPRDHRYARVTYDATLELIRADERTRYRPATMHGWPVWRCVECGHVANYEGTEEREPARCDCPGCERSGGRWQRLYIREEP